jgi:hypothetical protein
VRDQEEEHAAVLSGGQPLTERILARLGRPRWLWICLWGLTVVVRPVVPVVILILSGQTPQNFGLAQVLTVQGALAFSVVLLLWGVGHLANRAAAVAAELFGRTGEAVPQPVRGMDSIAGPALLTLLVVAITTADSWVRYGALLALANLPLLVITVLPIMTFVWTYLHLLAALNRLGRMRLALDPFPEDRTLGLGPVGSLASTGFVLLLAAVIPILLVSGSDTTTTVISVVVVVGSVGLLVLATWRLHERMSEAKAGYVALTRKLYAAAYEPLRSQPSLERLESQASALRAAQGLVERAENILEWPIDERAAARLAIIVTGVITGLLVRFVLTLAGL